MTHSIRLRFPTLNR
ncbi:MULTISPECIES: erythromycin resistance leader peptide [Paenibacillus]